jgi:hypothetical protein
VPQPAKRRELDFSEWKKVTENADEEDDDDVTRYTTEACDGRQKRSVGLVEVQKSTVYLRIAKLVRSVISVPANSSSSSEIVSDSASWTIDKRRTMPEPSTVEVIIFLNNNMQDLCE